MLAKLAPHHRATVASLLSATPEFTPEEVDVALELVDCALADPTSDDYRFILHQDGDRILGYACFGSTPMTQGCFDLYWLVVDRNARQSGVGRQLMGAMEDALRAEGARLVRVETAGLPSYEPARTFYRKVGYAETARIGDFYWPGNDLVIYTKYLVSP